MINNNIVPDDVDVGACVDVASVVVCVVVVSSSVDVAVDDGGLVVVGEEVVIGGCVIAGLAVFMNFKKY